LTAISSAVDHGEKAFRPRFALTAAALLLVGLGSCTADQPTIGAASPTTTPTTPTATAAGTSPAPGTHAPLAYAPATGSGPPSKLQNMSAPQVVALLGEPAFKREENPAQVWRYTSKSCVLELFLYRLDKDLQVRYVETRDAKANAVPQESCIANISAQKKTVAAK
jgi:hypothetical protein